MALHAELEYQLVKARGEEQAEQNFILAKTLVESATQRYGFSSVEVLAEFAGSKLENLVLQHPLITERQVPVILGEHVTDASGTGAVHTAPGHGVDDYKVFLL